MTDTIREQILAIRNTGLTNMFDVPMVQRLAYDRGYYHKFSELPYPIAQSQEELIDVIETFDHQAYQTALNDFMQNTIRICEKGEACKAQVEWMKKKSI